MYTYLFIVFVGYDDGCVRVFKVKAGTLLDTFHVNNTAVSSLEVRRPVIVQHWDY